MIGNGALTLCTTRLIINVLLLIMSLAASVNSALTARAVRSGLTTSGKLFKFPAVITFSISCRRKSSTVPSVPVAAAPVVTCTDALPVVGVSDVTPVASVTTAATTIAKCAYAAAVATLCASGSCTTFASIYARALITVALLPP